MVTIDIETHVAAPVERVFDLTRSIDLHSRSLAHTGERAVAGRTSGLIGPGETVTWRARHRPRYFQDRQVRGAFAWFEHEHFFTPAPGGGTVLRDVFRFAAPLGILGRIAEALVLRRYMTRFLQARNAVIKRVAESGEWREFLPE